MTPIETVLTFVGTLLTLIGAAEGTYDRLFAWTASTFDHDFALVESGMATLMNPTFPNTPRGAPGLQNQINGDDAKAMVGSLKAVRILFPNAQLVTRVVATYSPTGPWQIDFQSQTSGAFTSVLKVGGDVLGSLVSQYQKGRQSVIAFGFIFLGTLLILLALV